MSRGVLLLQNALAGRRRPLGPEAFLAVWATAVQGGGLGEAERALLTGLPLTPEGEQLRAALLRACRADGEAPNPEVAAIRRADPHFDRRLAALAAHARPGDLIFWRSAERRFPWSVMRRAYGPWMHVSLVLEDGRLLDPYWPEGFTVSTPEAALAKSLRRIRAAELLVARPARPLSAEALAAVTARAHAQIGRPYGLLALPYRPHPAASCSRAVWEVFHEQGIDLLADRERLYRSTITPRDVVQPGIALIREDGCVETEEFPSAEPGPLLSSFARGLERLVMGLPGGERLVLSLGRPLTWIFMVTMLPAAIAPPERPAPPVFGRANEGT